jgi:hypothetical protein
MTVGYRDNSAWDSSTALHSRSLGERRSHGMRDNADFKSRRCERLTSRISRLELNPGDGLTISRVLRERR